VTLILGVEDPENNRAIVFSDSGAWTGGFQQELDEPKVWRCGGWVLGAAGPIADSQSMRRRELLDPSEGVSRFDCLAKWVNGVLRELHQRDQALGATREDLQRGRVIAAHSGRVWEIDAVGAITRTTAGFSFAGYGEEATGAMVAIGEVSPTLAAMTRGATAMRVARSVNAKVHGRIDWKSTDGGEGSLE